MQHRLLFLVLSGTLDIPTNSIYSILCTLEMSANGGLWNRAPPLNENLFCFIAQTTQWRLSLNFLGGISVLRATSQALTEAFHTVNTAKTVLKLTYLSQMFTVWIFTSECTPGQFDHCQRGSCFWVTAPCRSRLCCQRFGDAYCLHLQGPLLSGLVVISISFLFFHSLTSLPLMSVFFFCCSVPIFISHSEAISFARVTASHRHMSADGAAQLTEGVVSEKCATTSRIVMNCTN
jgi:hypothetical protein